MSQTESACKCKCLCRIIWVDGAEKRTYRETGNQNAALHGARTGEKYVGRTENWPQRRESHSRIPREECLRT